MDRRAGSFVWDTAKEAINVRKHGVDFSTAATAFQDPDKKLFVDEAHGQPEERFFCLGKVEGRVLTVRFTYRAGLIRIYGAGYWRSGRRDYEQKHS